MLTVINFAIGLAFIYLLFSLVVTAVNEIWLSFLDKRADFLKEGLEQLLQDDAKLTKFLQHGLIDTLSRKTDGIPSYIPGETFTAAMLDIVHPADPSAPTDRTIADFRTGVTALTAGSKLKESLASILDEAGGDIDKFKKGVAAWYDGAMDRVTGWYKRYVQQWLLALGLVLAVACNVDTVHIMKVLSTDPKLLQSTVDQAVAYTKANAQSNGAGTTGDKTFEEALKNAQQAIANLDGVGVPVGWGDAQWNYLFKNGEEHWNWAHIASALCGWLLTGLAASMGAPFWFDTLNRFINIRGNGRAPEEKKI